MKLAFAGGGTGGHLAPAIALLEELRSRGDDSPALFLTGGRSAPGLANAFPGESDALPPRRQHLSPENVVDSGRGNK